MVKYYKKIDEDEYAGIDTERDSLFSIVMWIFMTEKVWIGWKIIFGVICLLFLPLLILIWLANWFDANTEDQSIHTRKK